MIGLVINNYISGVSDSIDTGKVTIVINEVTGIIEEILQGEAGEQSGLEIYTTKIARFCLDLSIVMST